MAWAHIQSAATTLNSSGVTFTHNIVTNPTAGSLIVVFAHWANQTVTTTQITDTFGNVYATAAAQVDITTVGRMQMWYAQNITAGGANTITQTFSGNVTHFKYLGAAEYSGLDTTSAFDQGTGASGNGTAMDSGAVVTTGAPELAVGWFFPSGTATANGAWNSRVTTNGDLMEDKNLVSAGSISAVAGNAPTGVWGAQIATFFEPGAGIVAIGNRMRRFL